MGINTLDISARGMFLLIQAAIGKHKWLNQLDGQFVANTSFATWTKKMLTTYVAYNAGEDGTLEKTNWMGTPWRQLGMGVWYQ